jgi:hypothetical protein
MCGLFKEPILSVRFPLCPATVEPASPSGPSPVWWGRTAGATVLPHSANRKFSCTETCEAFGVPEEITPTTSAAKYDVMTGTRLSFIEDRVVRLCRRLEAEDDVTVKAIDPAADGWFDTEDHPVLAEARRARLAAARAGFEMGVPFNELNRAFDLGFKPMPWGNQGYITTSVRPAGEGKAPTAKAESPRRGDHAILNSPSPGGEGKGEGERICSVSQHSAPDQSGADPFTRLTAALGRRGSQR